MNIPRYLYNENIKKDFINFLQEADKARNDVYCNFEKYQQMITLLPLRSEIKEDLKTCMENANICIDITQSDDETGQNCEPFKDKDDHVLTEISTTESLILPNFIQNLEEANINDITDSIKDSLYMQNDLLDIIIKDLSKLGNDNLDKVFLSLVNQLSLEDVENFWNTLMDSNINNEYVILCYARFLFLPRVKREFTDRLEAVFLSLSQKHPVVLKNELVKELLTVDLMEHEITNRVLHQYIGTLKNDFKMDVLRHFIYTCERLHPSYISVIEALLNPQTDYDILGKIIEVMSNSVTEFVNDNSYGKLLFNVVNLLERNVGRLEQPLKHILGIHRSIWKIKVHKVVISWIDDSLTQSLG